MAPPDDATLRAERELRESMDVATLRRRVAELEAALQFYADLTQYTRGFGRDSASPDGWGVQDAPIMDDAGVVARTALLTGQAGGGRRGEGGGGGGA